METFSLHITTRDSKPRIPFEKIKNTILGTSYELSLVLIGDTLGRRLNAEYKNKQGPTNVLSFPIGSDSGEIFINMRRCERDAKLFGHTTREHIAFLFIHGCLHLKGQEHGDEMEREEDRLLKKLL